MSRGPASLLHFVASFIGNNVGSAGGESTQPAVKAVKALCVDGIAAGRV
jgi:hypothetical protein